MLAGYPQSKPNKVFYSVLSAIIKKTHHASFDCRRCGSKKLVALEQLKTYGKEKEGKEAIEETLVSFRESQIPPLWRDLSLESSEVAAVYFGGMSTTFPYLEKDGQHFPVIHVLLQVRKKAIKVNSLVDSGASFSVFRPEIAEYLGIPIERGSPIYLTGIGGSILGYTHRVSMTAGGKTFRCKIIFSKEFTVSFNLLGRDNFFSPFVISFMEHDRKTVLAPLKKQ